MKKTVVLLLSSIFFIVVIFLSCASSGKNTASVQRKQWNNYHTMDSQDGSLIVFGVTSRMVTREEEIAAAQEDAARKVALFRGLKGLVESEDMQNGNFFDNMTNSTINIKSTVDDYSSFIEQLSFDPEKDIITIPGGMLVRFRYGRGIPRTNYRGTLGRDGRPSWIDSNNFNRAGYISAVGFSPTLVFLGDTIMKAAESAAALLLKGIETSIENIVVDISGEVTVTHSIMRSSGELNEFRILELWIDPDNLSVYVLGIAKAPN